MRNFGISLNGREARANGRAPASVVARWIGQGCTAAWVAQYVDRCEWHHSQANLGGDGRPTDYYERESVLAAWLAANLLAAHQGDARARKRLPELRRLRRVWGVPADEVAYELDQKLPVAPPSREADPLVGKRVRICRRYSVRNHSRFNRFTWYKETVEGLVVKATATYIIFEGGRRVGRGTVEELEVV